MERLFDAAAIKEQIANLVVDRERIDKTIEALETALKNIEGIAPRPGNLRFASEISLSDAVRKACIKMADAITRQRILSTLVDNFPLLKPKSSSVAAALINLSKGDEPMLKIAIEGRGSAPTVYSTESDMMLKLSSDEIEALMDPSSTKGSGGWQSLWGMLRKNFDASTGQIKLTPELRARIYQYYHDYGTGGWQKKVKHVFGRELPQLF